MKKIDLITRNSNIMLSELFDKRKNVVITNHENICNLFFFFCKNYICTFFFHFNRTLTEKIQKFFFVLFLRNCSFYSAMMH